MSEDVKVEVIMKLRIGGRTVFFQFDEKIDYDYDYKIINLK
jgi:hypothetical protein